MGCKEKAVRRQTTELQQSGERGAGTSKQPTWVFMRPAAGHPGSRVPGFSRPHISSSACC